MVIHCNWPLYSDFVSVSIHFCLYVIGTTLLQLSISTFFLCRYIPLCPCLYLCITGITPESLSICNAAVVTVGRLVQATLSLHLGLCLCAYMLLVPHWYCSSYVLVLLVLLVHWYQPLYVSVPICCWYRTGTALHMYWYCWYLWYIGTSHSMSLYQYVTGTALVLLFICTGTAGTVRTLVPATLSPFVSICYWYHTGTALYMYWYCKYCGHIGTSNSMPLCLYITGTTLVLLFICTGTAGTVGTLVPATMSLYQYVTGTALVLLFICTGTAGPFGTLVPATLCLCTNMLLVLHWYCCLYVLVLLVLLVHWYQSLCLHLCLYDTGTTLVLLFICTGTVGTVGTLVRATLCLCGCVSMCLCGCCVSVPGCLCGYLAVCSPYPFVHHVPGPSVYVYILLLCK